MVQDILIWNISIWGVGNYEGRIIDNPKCSDCTRNGNAVLGALRWISIFVVLS